MEYVIDSCIRGHHIYKEVWSPFVNEKLTCAIEEGNNHDPYAVAVMKGELIVGHVPRKISATCSLFLRRNRLITARVTDSRQYSRDLPQGGLEVPCVLKFIGEEKYVEIKILLPHPTNTEPMHDEEQPAASKKRKLSDVEEIDDTRYQNDNEDYWVRFGILALKVKDRKLVAEGKELNDTLINFVQSLIKHQFSDTPIEGFVSTHYFSQKGRVTFTVGCPVIQIVHIHGNHWIVATTDGITKEVYIYDSLYSNVNISTQELIAENFGMDRIEVVPNAPKQKGTKDCGIFAIAVSISLAYHYSHNQPLLLSYNQDLMRNHLIECYINKCIKLFPLL